MPSATASAKDRLHPVWVMRWARADTLRRWADGNGPAVMSAERLSALVEEARQAGFAAGDLYGRADLRESIRRGDVPGVREEGVGDA